MFCYVEIKYCYWIGMELDKMQNSTQYTEQNKLYKRY